MVSLHGSTAALSDAITGAPGTFATTVHGIDALVQTPVHVRLNFVFCRANREDFPRFVEFVAGRWPSLVGGSSLDTRIVFSFVGSHTDVVPRSRTLIPSFTEIMPSLLGGLARARALGLQVGGFDSMCGLPLCLVPPEERSQFSTVELELGGRAIPEGSIVLGIIGAANRDPAMFPDPDRLDLARTDNRHLAFGGGIHFCLGAALARLEAQIAFGALVRRLPRLALATPTPEWRPAAVLRGLTALPVTF